MIIELPNCKIYALFQIYSFDDGKYVDYLSVLIYRNQKPKCKVIRIFDKPQYFDSECGFRCILFKEKQQNLMIKRK